MKKTILLLAVLAVATSTLAGCGHWGCWDGHGHHSHYRGCGHPDY